MEKSFHILTILILWTHLSFGQSLDKKYIDNWVLNTFLNSEISENTLYILDGRLLNNDSLDNQLSKFQQTDIVSIDCIDQELTDSWIFCRPLKDLILMTSKGMQTKRLIRVKYNKAKTKYLSTALNTNADINQNTDEPVLIINDVQIDYRECYKRINEVRLKQIIGIQYIEKPVNQETYGANAINGLIKIITK